MRLCSGHVTNVHILCWCMLLPVVWWTLLVERQFKKWTVSGRRVYCPTCLNYLDRLRCKSTIIRVFTTFVASTRQRLASSRRHSFSAMALVSAVCGTFTATHSSWISRLLLGVDLQNDKDVHVKPVIWWGSFLFVSDLFFTRVFPSKMFDVLKEDFEYLFISAVLAGMIAVSFLTRKLAQRKALAKAWK